MSKLWLVTMKAGSDAASAAKKITASGIDVVNVMPVIGVIVVSCEDADVDLIRKIDDVSAVDPDQQVSLIRPIKSK